MEPTFTQPERRSYLIPILVALAALVAAALLATHFYPATTIDIAHIHTDLLPTHTVYKSNSIVVGAADVSDVLFLAETVKVTNQLRVPISTDDVTLTFTNAAGQQLTTKALEKDELANIELSFPALKPLMTHSLYRDTVIDPTQSAQGTLLFALQVPRPMYDTRKSAVIKLSLYHQNPVYQTIP